MSAAPSNFERGRSYGTLPATGRLQSQDSVEREHASDTEAPLATQEVNFMFISFIIIQFKVTKFLKKFLC